MNVALVPHIEDQAVLGRIVDAVQRHCQLHRPQVGGQVPAGASHALHQKGAQFFTQSLQIRRRQGLDIRR